MKNFNDFLKKQLEKPEIAKEYRRVDPFFQLSREIIRMRNKRGITQKELAVRIGSTQAVISRIESCSVNSSLGTIQKIAEALDSKFLLQIEPNEIVPLLEEFVIEPITAQQKHSFEIREQKSSCLSTSQPINIGFPLIEWEIGKDITTEATKPELCLS